MLRDLLVPTYAQMLAALSAWLDKAEAEQGLDARMLPLARLAPDMFPLATQVRFACVQAIEGVHRLTDQPLPPLAGALLDEGRTAAEQPGTLADARARIRQTLDLVQAVVAAADELPRHAPIAHALPQGMIFDLDAEQYGRDWALPQFYFHVMTAYAILRAQGVALGKIDYVAHMLPYLRHPG